MSPARLLTLARLLYGPHPIHELSLHLHRPNSPTPSVDYTLVRRWLSEGKHRRKIPSWVEGEVRRLLSERAKEIELALAELIPSFICGIFVLLYLA